MELGVLQAPIKVAHFSAVRIVLWMGGRNTSGCTSAQKHDGSFIRPYACISVPPHFGFSRCPQLHPTAPGSPVNEADDGYEVGRLAACSNDAQCLI